MIINLTGKFMIDTTVLEQYNKFTSEVNQQKGKHDLDIKYKNKTIEKVCTKQSEAIRRYGPRMAEKIDQRIGEIMASDSVEFMIKYRIGRCQPLTNNRKAQYAVDLVHPYRMGFEYKGEEVQIELIIEIVDYH